jgi:hypothetical protein
MTNETEVLEMALVGYRKRIAEIEARLIEILNQGAPLPQMQGAGSWIVTKKKARPMSPESRQRIAAAQKKRWAKYRREHKAA